MRGRFCIYITLGFLGFLYHAHSEILSVSGWMPQTRVALEKIIQANGNKNLDVVFDFDNTLVCRDIGEATFAVLLKNKVISTQSISKEISPDFLIGSTLVKLSESKDPSYYYEEYLKATSHHKDDSSAVTNAYAWMVQATAGLSPDQIVAATKEAYADGKGERDPLSEIETPGGAKYRIPYFYPQMVDLVGAFLKNGYRVWVVSASNVWSVRWMVAHVLNEKLRSKGLNIGVPPENVVGISTLLSDQKGELSKDDSLVKENVLYANLNAEELRKFKLTNQIVYPLSAYEGKVATILQKVGRTPYFIAGDSLNDHPMLAYAENRLWIARLEKPDYQEKTLELVKVKGKPGKWIVQPTLIGNDPGFRSQLEGLPKDPKIEASIAALKKMN